MPDTASRRQHKGVGVARRVGAPWCSVPLLERAVGGALPPVSPILLCQGEPGRRRCVQAAGHAPCTAQRNGTCTCCRMRSPHTCESPAGIVSRRPFRDGPPPRYPLLREPHLATVPHVMPRTATWACAIRVTGRVSRVAPSSLHPSSPPPNPPSKVKSRPPPARRPTPCYASCISVRRPATSSPLRPTSARAPPSMQRRCNARPRYTGDKYMDAGEMRHGYPPGRVACKGSCFSPSSSHAFDTARILSPSFTGSPVRP